MIRGSGTQGVPADPRAQRPGGGGRGRARKKERLSTSLQLSSGSSRGTLPAVRRKAVQHLGFTLLRVDQDTGLLH